MTLHSEGSCCHHLEFLIIFGLGDLHFHCALSSTNYVVGCTSHQCPVICVWKKPAPKLRANPFTVCQLVSNVLGFCQITWSTQVSHLRLTLHFRYTQLFTVAYCFILLVTLHKLWLSSFLDQTQHESIFQILVHVISSLWILLGLLYGRRMCSLLFVYIHTHIITLTPLYYNYLFIWLFLPLENGLPEGKHYVQFISVFLTPGTEPDIHKHV